MSVELVVTVNLENLDFFDRYLKEFDEYNSLPDYEFIEGKEYKAVYDNIRYEIVDENGVELSIPGWTDVDRTLRYLVNVKEEYGKDNAEIIEKIKSEIEHLRDDLLNMKGYLKSGDFDKFINYSESLDLEDWDDWKEELTEEFKKSREVNKEDSIEES